MVWFVSMLLVYRPIWRNAQRRTSSASVTRVWITGSAGMVEDATLVICLINRVNSDELDNTTHCRDQYSFLPECGLVAVSNLLKFGGHHLYIRLGDVDIENLGHLLFTLPESYAIDDSAELQDGSDKLTGEMIEHLITNCASVGNVATHRHLKSDRVHVCLCLFDSVSMAPLGVVWGDAVPLIQLAHPPAVRGSIR